MKTNSILISLGVLRDAAASSDLIAKKQSKRLSLLLQHAYEKVPYYKRLFDDNGLSPNDIQTTADLCRLPITSKPDIQDLPITERIPTGINPDSLKSLRTSGSTGTPLNVCMSKTDTDVNNALTFRIMRSHGMKAWHSKMSIRGTRPTNIGNSRLNSLIPFRRGYLSASSSAEEWITNMKKFRPDYLMGFPATLQLIARAVKEDGTHEIRPRYIMTTGSILTPDVKNEISEGFSAPIRDIYGSWEGGIMAWECDQCKGYHINSDWVIIEILKNGRPANPGEEGEVVITNLHSFGMPFIRYRQGDLAVRHQSESSCKSNMPLLKSICGRTTDLLHLPDGRSLSPQMMLIFIDSVPGIKTWRLTQLKPDYFRIEVVPTREFNKETEMLLHHKLCEALKTTVHVEISKVDNLSPDKNGKFHYVVSALSDK